MTLSKRSLESFTKRYEGSLVRLNSLVHFYYKQDKFDGYSNLKNVQKLVQKDKKLMSLYKIRQFTYKIEFVLAFSLLINMFFSSYVIQKIKHLMLNEGYVSNRNASLSDTFIKTTLQDVSYIQQNRSGLYSNYYSLRKNISSKSITCLETLILEADRIWGGCYCFRTEVSSR